MLITVIHYVAGNAMQHGMLRPSTNDDAVCVNAAAEINMP